MLDRLELSAVFVSSACRRRLNFSENGSQLPKRDGNFERFPSCLFPTLLEFARKHHHTHLCHVAHSRLPNNAAGTRFQERVLDLVSGSARLPADLQSTQEVRHNVAMTSAARIRLLSLMFTFSPHFLFLTVTGSIRSGRSCQSHSRPLWTGLMLNRRSGCSLSPEMGERFLAEGISRRGSQQLR